MSVVNTDLYEFGSYRLDVRRRVFTHGEQVVALAPKTFELLLLMLRNPGRAFSKQELMAALWPDTFVEEANLSFQIWVAKPDGSNPQRITSVGGPQCANPQWSPDGRWILFNSRREGPADRVDWPRRPADRRPVGAGDVGAVP